MKKTLQKNSFLYFLLCNLLLFGLVGCDKKKPTKQPPLAKLGSVRIFIDKSASMAGYFKETGEFRSIVSDLASKINKEMPVPIEIYWIDNDSITKYTNQVSQLSRDLLLNNDANGDTTLLHKSIKKIASFLNDTTVVIYISDLILSGSTADINRSNNGAFNIIEADNTLRKQIYEIFYDSIANKNFKTNIFQFVSIFNGNYYNYKNTKLKLSNAKRPFYLTMLGSEQHLNNIENKLNTLNFFKDNLQHVAYFSKQNEQLPIKYTIFPNIQKKGKWIPASAKDGNKMLKNFQPERDDTSSFLLALDLSKTNLIIDNATLRNLMNINCANCSLTTEILDKSAISDKDKINSKENNELFQNATNFVKFHVYEMPLDTARITFELKRLDQAWIANAATMNDSLAEVNLGKTFALNYLIKGLNEAYKLPTNSLSFDIILNK